MFAAAPLLLGAACEKKKPTDTGAITAADRIGSAGDTAPLTGIDVSKLDADKQKLFYGLVASLNSPCGKSENLRASFTKDTACKRAPFAVKYVLAMVEDEFPESAAREAYAAKYEKKDTVKLEPGKAPHIGNDDAPVRIVEFYDYACHVCKDFKPVLDKVIEQHGDKLVVYFMMYPTGNWVDSKSAAQASIAAAAQGKFKEMHAILFADPSRHNHAAVTAHATQLGLDLPKFEADYAAAAAQVDADHKHGESVGVSGTPSVFFNNRRLEAPPNPKYIGMWIEEEVAVNR